MPLAAMMTAFKKVAVRAPTGTLVLVAAAEEEVGGQLGTKWLADAGHLPEADFIVVGEQTRNRVALAHKGVMTQAPAQAPATMASSREWCGLTCKERA